MRPQCSVHFLSLTVAALAASSQHGLELELEFRDTTDLKRTLAAQLTVVWVDTGTNMVYESVDLNSFSPLISKMSTMPIKVAYQVRASSP